MFCQIYNIMTHFTTKMFMIKKDVAELVTEMFQTTYHYIFPRYKHKYMCT